MNLRDPAGFGDIYRSTEVAERLGVSEATARARVSRGLRALGAALDLRLSTQETLG